jgi:DNA ligase-1
MNSSEIFDAIERIATESSKKEKEALVREFAQDPEFLRVLKLAYDPFLTYGVAETTLKGLDAGGFGTEDFDDTTWACFDKLSTRTLSGTAAQEAVEKEFRRLNRPSSILLRRVLLKDLRAGFGENTINKAKPGAIPDFPYMRCSLPESSKIDEWDWSLGVISQEKADGMFVNVNLDKTEALWLTTRQGSPIPLDRLGDLPNQIADVFDPGTQTHGELLVCDVEEDMRVLPREQGNGMLNSILKGGALDPRYVVKLKVWDQIPLTSVVPKGKYTLHYVDRLKKLIGQIHKPCHHGKIDLVELIQTQVVRTRQEAQAHFMKMLREGKEGTIVKNRHAIWRDGTSKDQVKFKLEVDVDLRIVGFVEGSGKNAATFGSILCQSGCGQLEVAVSGFSDKQRDEISLARDTFIDTIMTVRANAIMRPSAENGKHSLFLPRWVEFRNDKVIADHLHHIEAQFGAAAGVAA